VRRIFSEIAPRYDLLNHVLSLTSTGAWRRRALAALGWDARPGGVYLDLCAGRSTWAPSSRARPASAGWCSRRLRRADAARRGGKAPRAALAPVAADALELPFADGSADGAIVAFGIRNVADLDGALGEVRRVLKPGARFVILEFTTPPNALVRAATTPTSTTCSRWWDAR
jgi:demethylmenaquinone methyltransferase/2-methoxy-6-polyprenyl-1,4-benzoquinol methylase